MHAVVLGSQNSQGLADLSALRPVSCTYPSAARCLVVLFRIGAGEMETEQKDS